MDQDERYGRKRRLVTASALTVLTLAGCTNLKSQRFDVGASRSGTTIGGIPFTLNRPRLTVVRTPGVDGKPASYAVLPTFEPDPKQRFVLELDPALLSEADFKIDLDDKGSISGVTAKTTNQLPAILTSLVKAGLSLATLDATNAKDETSTARAIIADLTRDLSQRRVQIWDTALGAMRTATPREISASKLALKSLGARLLKAASYGEAGTTFTYENGEERTLLLTALHGIQPPPRAVIGAPDTVATLIASSDAGQKGRGVEIDALYQKLDRQGLKSIVSAQEKAIDQLYASYAQVPPKPADGNKALTAAREVLDAATFAIGRLVSDDQIKLLLTILERPSADWQRRMVADLDTSIAARRLTLRLGANGALADESHDASLTLLLRRRAMILGVLPQYDRRQLLEQMIVSQHGKGDYKSLSDEIAYLDRRLNDAETTIKAASTDPKADDPVPAAFMTGDGNAIDSAWIVTRLDEHGAWDRPQYVVVFEPIAAKGGTSSATATARANPIGTATTGTTTGTGATTGTTPAPAGGTIPATPGIPPIKSKN
jgi:hypothetical protein